MNESKQELLRGTLDMLILKVVALGPSHGYAIAQRSPEGYRPGPTNRSKTILNRSHKYAPLRHALSPGLGAYVAVDQAPYRVFRTV